MLVPSIGCCSTPLTLDGHELVYVTASGATITRKAIWGPGVEIAPGAHVLVGNEAGIFAGVADVTYANGLAATGGSMALRLVGASTAVDAVGWGTAASTWLEGVPAPAPPASSSLERLPGVVGPEGLDHRAPQPSHDRRSSVRGPGVGPASDSMTEVGSVQARWCP